MTNCEQIKEFYEAYALGSLDLPERQLVEAHLASGCESCIHEIHRARWLVSQLAYLAPEREPSRGLRRRILRSVVEGAKSERRATMPAWAWIAAAALVLFTVFSVYETGRARKEMARLQVELEKGRQQQKALELERNTSEEALAILSATGTHESKLKAREAALPDIHAYWNPSRGLLISGNHIPKPSENRTFQLWLVPKSGNPISAGIFRPDLDGRVLTVSAVSVDPAFTAALAISEEPAGGLPQPTKDQIRWVGPIP